MSTERPKGISIATGHLIVDDDKTPTIDPYGLAMVESLCGALQQLCAGESDLARKKKLEELMQYAENIADRYS